MTLVTDAARENVTSTSADEPLLVLLEISHPDLEVPVRVVNDTQDFRLSRGRTFFACAFQLTMPDDKDQQVPQASLSVDNIGRDLTQWLEYSRGGAGAKCRIILALRSQTSSYFAEDYDAEDYAETGAGVIEFEMLLDMTNIYITNERVHASLGFRHTLGQAASALRYDPMTTPALF